MSIRWTGEFIAAFVWLVLVLSIGAVLLLLLLLRRGTAAGVSSLYYLVPVATAVGSGLQPERPQVPVQPRAGTPAAAAGRLCAAVPDRVLVADERVAAVHAEPEPQRGCVRPE